jgi:hypothetical protein
MVANEGNQNLNSDEARSVRDTPNVCNSCNRAESEKQCQDVDASSLVYYKVGALSPEVALEKYRSMLTSYEITEILEYRGVSRIVAKTAHVHNTLRKSS